MDTKIKQNINTQKYWEDRFQNNWKLLKGDCQTEFFAEIAISLMPEWLKEEIMQKKYTICDFGCALGDAVDLLAKNFVTKVVGVDFAENAIEQARLSYPQHEFFVDDLSNSKIENVDISFSSNVLEHLDNPWNVLKSLVNRTKYYSIVLVPFREEMVVDEHINKFDVNSIPLHIQNFELIYSNYMDCSKIEGTLYADKQILLVYANTKQIDIQRKLSDLVNTFEDKLLSAKTILEKELQILEKRYKEKDKEAFNALALLEDYKKSYNKLETENDHLNMQIINYKETCNKLEVNIEHLTKQNFYMADFIYNLQIELEKIKGSLFWRISKPLRYLMKLIIRIIYWIKKFIKCDNKYMLLFERLYRSRFGNLVKKVCPKVIKKQLVTKLYSNDTSDLKLPSSRQEALINEEIEIFEKNLKDSDKIILVFSGVKYVDSEGQRNIRLIHEAVKKGRKVIFAYWRWDVNEDLETSDSNILKIPMDYFGKNGILFFQHYFLKQIAKCVLVEFPHPQIPRMLEIARAFSWISIYDVIDDWEEFAKYGQANWYDKKVEERLCNIVDINIATANKLKHKLSKSILLPKPYYVISNGVDTSKIIRCDKEPQYNYNKGDIQIGYFGHLTDAWFDWDLVKEMASNHSNWTFHIIGYGEPDNLVLPDNIVFYGKKLPIELGKYAAYWDVAMIPFINCELTKGVNPIKVFEYLQLNLPVVASDMPEIQNYPYTQLAIGTEAFEKAIIKASHMVLERKVIDEFIQKNTWEVKCEHLLYIIDNYS